MTDGEPTFIWRDLQGDIDELYEFVAIGTNAPTRAFFEMCMYRAMFERKYRRAGDNAVDKELEEFIWQYVVARLTRCLCILTSHQTPYYPYQETQHSKEGVKELAAKETDFREIGR